MGGRKERKCNRLEKKNLSELMITSENPYLLKCSFIRFFLKRRQTKILNFSCSIKFPEPYTLSHFAFLFNLFTSLGTQTNEVFLTKERQKSSTGKWMS